MCMDTKVQLIGDYTQEKILDRLRIFAEKGSE